MTLTTVSQMRKRLRREAKTSYGSCPARLPNPATPRFQLTGAGPGQAMPHGPRVRWAVRRLTGGPGPKLDLAALPDRRDPENTEHQAGTFADRAGGWLSPIGANRRSAPNHPRLQGLPCRPRETWRPGGSGCHTRGPGSKRAGFAPLVMGGRGPARWWFSG